MIFKLPFFYVIELSDGFKILKILGIFKASVNDILFINFVYID